MIINICIVNIDVKIVVWLVIYWRIEYLIFNLWVVKCVYELDFLRVNYILIIGDGVKGKKIKL